MYRYLTNLFCNSLLILSLICLSFFSCVYYNTFYNAEISFKKAIKIIEESPLIVDNALPSQAKKLLGESIDNSKLVIQNYPESKYVDDAIFIIAKSAFLRNESAIAERHFNLLLKQYPGSEYYLESKIWLAYSNFRLGLIDSSKNEIENIIKEKIYDKSKLYIIHNLLAEISLVENNLEKVYENYEMAAKYASSESKKTSSYSKLVKISELNFDKNKSIKYLEELGKVSPDKIRIDAKMKWIVYKRELGDYDDIINEIEMMLSLSEFSSEYIQLELELGKVYMEKGDLTIAKDIFLQMVDVYSKKNETSEAYYQLANMSLLNGFNLILTKEYLEKSKVEKSQSRYGKKSKELLKKINRFEDMESAYKDLAKEYNKFKDLKSPIVELVIDTIDVVEVDNIDENIIGKESNEGRINFSQPKSGEDSSLDKSTDLAPDSILFMIGEMLLYDFQNLELSLDRFKILADQYPYSKFASQSLYVLSHFEPNQDWYNLLIENFPMSSFLMKDTLNLADSKFLLIQDKRDYAWSLAKKSYNHSYNEFYRLYQQEGDTLSAYICGFIGDYYLNNLELAIFHYQSFIDKYPNNTYAKTIQDRLLEIRTTIEEKKEISKQAIDYFSAIDLLINDFNYDSVLVLLKDLKSGPSKIYNEASSLAESSINSYIELNSKINDFKIVLNSDSLLIENRETSKDSSYLDSLYFSMAQLFSKDFQIIDSANYYNKYLVTNFIDSEYRINSLLYLSDKDINGEWSDVLMSDYGVEDIEKDTTIIRPVYLEEIYSDQFIFNLEYDIVKYEKYLDLFSSKIDSTTYEVIDTGTILNDSISIDRSSMNSPSNRKVTILK